MRRIPELDSIRGLAALAVVLYHLSGDRLHGLWAAVDCFFVLSGYLITSIALKHGSEPGFLRKFYARRSLRIWPIYYLGLAAVLIYNSGITRHPEATDAWPYYLTYTQHVQGYFGTPEPRFPSIYIHTWTLAIEEQFYILWPAMVLLLGKRSIVPLAILSLILSAYLRSLGFSPWLLLARDDGLLLGGMLAVLMSPKGWGRVHPRWTAGALLALMVVALGWLLWRSVALGPSTYLYAWSTPHLADSILAFNLAFAGIVGLTAIGAGKAALAPLRLRPLAYIGTISYGLYLWHYPIFSLKPAFAIRFGGRGSLWVDALFLSLAFLAAILSWHLIEQPIMRLKRRFEYQAKPTARPPS